MVAMQACAAHAAAIPLPGGLARLPACRALLSCLCEAFPELPVVGLVDWNPSGASILSTYRFGSQRMSQESSRYALPSLGWLGARHEQLRGADDGAFQVRCWEGGYPNGRTANAWMHGSGMHPWQPQHASRCFHASLPSCPMQELTPRDRSLAANLSAALRSACPGWAAELQQMLSSGCKAEIEALYTLEGEGGAAGFADFLEHCLEEGDWV